MSELPEFIYFNPLSFREANARRPGAYQLYVRTHKYVNDAVYRLVSASEQLSEDGE